ncbi:MAG TPA: hypothetical protein VGI03_15825 [Verrucomicrobiae bacterium]|jgi:hypothetical protein
MTDEELSNLPTYRWTPSRIPLRDALSTFVPDAPEPEPIITEMGNRCGEIIWHPVKGGHRVLFLYDGGAFDSSRFTLELKVWDYDECAVCGKHIPAKTLCHVTEPQQPYVLLCADCYDRYVVSKSHVA